MNDTEQRIAIAEACGWKFCPSKDNPLTGNAEPDVWVDPFGNKFWEDMPTHLPDYLNDLNAMHEAEGILTQLQQESFVHTLIGLICDPVEIEYGPLNLTQADVLWMVTHATAPQRAEAFLRTLGKWKEESK